MRNKEESGLQNIQTRQKVNTAEDRIENREGTWWMGGGGGNC
jgi:hypothetical protein